MSTNHSIGSMNQLADSLDRVGFSPDEVTKLRTYRDLGLIRLLVNGQAEIRIIRRILKLAKSFDITEFSDNKNWSVWKGPVDGDGKEGDEDRDMREDVLSTINLADVQREVFLSKGENSINGEECLQRLKASNNIQLGGRTFLALWQDYKMNKTDKANTMLEYLYKVHGVTYVDFFGLVLRDPGGGRCVLYLDRVYDFVWNWACRQLVYDWNSNREPVSLPNL